MFYDLDKTICTFLISNALIIRRRVASRGVTSRHAVESAHAAAGGTGWIVLQRRHECIEPGNMICAST